jgi:hypothetical protein
LIRVSCQCSSSRSKRLSRLREQRAKQIETIQKKCGNGSIAFDVIPSKECIVLWSELEETMASIHTLAHEDMYFGLDAENRTYDV